MKLKLIFHSLTKRFHACERSIVGVLYQIEPDVVGGELKAIPQSKAEIRPTASWTDFDEKRNVSSCIGKRRNEKSHTKLMMIQFRLVLLLILPDWFFIRNILGRIPNEGENQSNFNKTDYRRTEWSAHKKFTSFE